MPERIEPARAKELATLYARLATELAEWQKTNAVGEENRSANPPTVWKLHQIAYEYFKASNQSAIKVEVEPYLARANEVLGSMGTLFAHEFVALSNLMGEVSFKALAPYDANGTQTTEIW